MNMKRYYRRNKPEFMIIPMIDIIFFLLVFFMMNSLETTAQKTLDVQLPVAQHAETAQNLPLMITLDAAGHITLGNEPVSFAEAQQRITEQLQANPQAAVVLQADKRTAHGQVVAIMDMLKGAGVHKLAISADKGSER